MTSGIYAITNTVTGEQYVGSSRDIEKRWKQHRDLLRVGKHQNTMFQRAWNQSGEDVFVFDILDDGVDDATLLEREAFYASILRPAFNSMNLHTSTWRSVTVTMTWEYRCYVEALTVSRWKSRAEWLDALLREDPFVSAALNGEEPDSEDWEAYAQDSRRRHVRNRRPGSGMTFRLTCEVVAALDRVAPISRGAYLEDIIAREVVNA